MDIKGNHPLPDPSPPPPRPHRENGPPNEKKSLLYGENGHSKGEKHVHVPTLIFFSSPEIEIPLIASPPWLALAWPIDNKINNIFRNYSSRNYIKIHSRMHLSALFHKKILERAYLQIL